LNAEQTLLAHLPEQIVRGENAAGFPSLRMRIDLGFDEPRKPSASIRGAVRYKASPSLARADRAGLHRR